jgi:hypothetical protein
MGLVLLGPGAGAAAAQKGRRRALEFGRTIVDRAGLVKESWRGVGAAC